MNQELFRVKKEDVSRQWHRSILIERELDVIGTPRMDFVVVLIESETFDSAVETRWETRWMLLPSCVGRSRSLWNARRDIMLRECKSAADGCFGQQRARCDDASREWRALRSVEWDFSTIGRDWKAPSRNHLQIVKNLLPRRGKFIPIVLNTLADKTSVKVSTSWELKIEI